MKIKLSFPNQCHRGYALLMVLMIATFTLVILAATISRTASTTNLNNRNNQYVTGLYAAEAATEKVLARMKYDFAVGQLAAVSNNLSSYLTDVPTSSEDSYWGQFQFSDGQGNLNQTYVQCVYSTGFGPLSSQFIGLNGWTNTYRVVSNVSQKPSLNRITNAVQQEVQLALIPVFQFAIFYNSLLEFTTCAPLTIAGRVHANSNIFVGSSNPLIFNNTVTATGSVTNPPWAGWAQSQFTSTTTYNGIPPYAVIANALALPIGTNAAYNTPDSVREIINMPPVGESPTNSLGAVRYYNEADVVLLVSNTTVTAMIKVSPTDTPTNILATYYPTNLYASNYVQITTNFPFLNVTNLFTDMREGDLVKVTQIDVAAYNKWLITNPVVTSKFPNTSGVYPSTGAGAPNILYVADNRTNSSGQLTAVRLQNGSVIPTNMINWGASSNQPSGFTVATPNPLYVKGNYNTAAGGLGYTNSDGSSTEFPASLVSDAITILSANWADSASGGIYSSRTAANTTINAAILAGVVYSTGSAASQYSGGAHNLTRLLENWANYTLTLNTSLVNLYNSVRANTQFQFPTAYYQVPKQRNFNFDLNFLSYTKLPPGTPILPVVIRQKWIVPPPNNVNYTNNS